MKPSSILFSLLMIFLVSVKAMGTEPSRSSQNVVSEPSSDLGHEKMQHSPPQFHIDMERLRAAASAIKGDYVGQVNDVSLLENCIERMRGVAKENPEFPKELLKAPNPSFMNGVERFLSDLPAQVQQTDISWRDKFTDACINGMVSGLDKHSRYYDKSEFRELRDSTLGKFAGVGLELKSENGFTRIVSVIENSPAYRAGVKDGDLLLSIDDTSVRGQSLTEVVNRLRGKVGQIVHLTIERAGVKEPWQFDIPREPVTLQSVRSKILEKKYLYIKISSFQAGTLEELAKALRRENNEDADRLKGLILDLRNNPGGILPSSIGVAAAFLQPSDLVLTADSRAEGKTEFYAKPQHYLYGTTVDPFKNIPDQMKSLPMVVIVNHVSASGSEIVAAALKDHHRAKLIGQTTFGMGTGQIIRVLPSDTALKITQSKFYRPNGEAIEEVGVRPDILAESQDQEMPPWNGPDPILDQAINALVNN